MIYNLLLFLLSPLLLLYYAFRMATGKEDPVHWHERWGRYAKAGEGSPRFWVHAVSVGEVMAAKPILRELRRRHPEAFLLLTTTTRGGREVAQGIADASAVAYFPLDFPWAVTRALKAVRPDAILLMEWEIWPNFLKAAKQQGAKVIVLNGRISDKGLRRGLKARWLMESGLDCVDLFAMQSDEDTRRAGLVGAPAERTQTFGNTKFDESSTMLSIEERVKLRAELGIPEGALVWICGSTRDGKEGVPDEEVLIAEAAKRVRERFPELRLIVAPRHLERVEAVKAHLPFAVLRTQVPPILGAGGALILDTFGELGRAYAVADVAFIGGSLAPWGGQSVFQPLAQGVPALFGPNMNNQRDIAALAIAEGVAEQVADTNALAEAVCRWLALSPEKKAQNATKARGLIERNQGVSAKCLDAVEALLGR
ncbi:glycosyltransferase N-terminal domain-containing protein [Armatimonas sp.]|uniref:3-deoxy-D-manno-octulosonic acid transferase n=1 Tax=Armatimonas sp. TaxID=1872638 RepID=UPI00286D4B19|nr:glycosyltransferase N-terminal domain-containing protein [Armatimonas sp.]